MNREFEDDLERQTERRSRRNPRLRETETDNGSQREIPARERQERTPDYEAELDIMGTSSYREKKPGAYAQTGSRTGAGTGARAAGTGTRTAGTGAGTRAAGGSAAAAARSTGSAAGRQTAAAAGAGGGGGLPPRRAAELKRRKKRRRIIAMIVAECFALVFIFGYAFVARTLAMLQRPEDINISEIPTNDIAVETTEKMKGYWTIAVFGVDARDNAITKGTNADVNMICNINRDTGEIKLVSVYRDTYLSISENGSYNKINQAYFLGGPEQAVAAMNRNLDLQINDYMTFNWKAVANAIDILGGVDIELSKAEFYYINSFISETVKATGIGSHQLTRAGMNHLDGVQAVAYGRLRLMDTDYARTERQRKVIAQAFEKAKKVDFQTLYVLIGTVFPQVSTSIWVDDLVSNAKNINKFHLGETTGFPQARGDANMGKKGAVVVPATLESNVIKLHEFLYGDEAYTPSDNVKKISAHIASDTGIYKEGQFIDKVGTSGGVIQPPKTTAASTSERKDDDEGYQTVYVLDGSGKKVKKRIEMETDEDGEYIEWETDEDGILIEETTKSTIFTMGTDENGDPVESSSASRPTVVDDPYESGAADDPRTPTDSTSSSSGRPGSNSQEPTIGNTPLPSPGVPDTSSGSGTTSRPGAAETSSGVTSRPGADNSPSGGSSPTAAPNGPDGPGTSAGTTAAPIPQFPGGNTSENAGSQGPGGADNVTDSPAGVVAAPGQ